MKSWYGSAHCISADGDEAEMLARSNNFFCIICSRGAVAVNNCGDGGGGNMTGHCQLMTTIPVSGCDSPEDEASESDQEAWQ